MIEMGFHESRLVLCVFSMRTPPDANGHPSLMAPVSPHVDDGLAAGTDDANAVWRRLQGRQRLSAWNAVSSEGTTSPWSTASSSEHSGPISPHGGVLLAGVAPGRQPLAGVYLVLDARTGFDALRGDKQMTDKRAWTSTSPRSASPSRTPPPTGAFAGCPLLHRRLPHEAPWRRRPAGGPEGRWGCETEVRQERERTKQLRKRAADPRKKPASETASPSVDPDFELKMYIAEADGRGSPTTAVP